MSIEELAFTAASGHSTCHEDLSNSSITLIPLEDAFVCSVLLTHQVNIDHRN
jgi:hypothetical protein